MSNIIELKSVFKTYGTKIKNTVLTDINLTIKRNSFNWIIGPSGSGKTTMLNIISGLDQATNGEVIINGNDISLLSENELAKFRANNLGFVFQFHYLLPEFNAIENILLPFEIRKIKINKDIIEKANNILESVGLLHVKNNYPNEMSGGELQRLALARAIISEPELIIADEPTGNLDSENAKQVYKIIRELQEKYEMTFIIVTHDQIKPLKGDRLITLKDGRIAEDVTF